LHRICSRALRGSPTGRGPKCRPFIFQVRRPGLGGTRRGGSGCDRSGKQITAGKSAARVGRLSSAVDAGGVGGADAALMVSVSCWWRQPSTARRWPREPGRGSSGAGCRGKVPLPRIQSAWVGVGRRERGRAPSSWCRARKPDRIQPAHGWAKVEEPGRVPHRGVHGGRERSPAWEGCNGRAKRLPCQACCRSEAEYNTPLVPRGSHPCSHGERSIYYVEKNHTNMTHYTRVRLSRRTILNTVKVRFCR
jgi:hypothetical protein